MLKIHVINVLINNIIYLKVNVLLVILSILNVNFVNKKINVLPVLMIQDILIKVFVKYVIKLLIIVSNVHQLHLAKNVNKVILIKVRRCVHFVVKL